MTQQHDLIQVNYEWHSLSMPDAYERRAGMLQNLGFADYQEYLQSSMWKEIRNKVLADEAECCGCSRKATQVHHGDYSEETLSGASIKSLRPVCAGHHYGIEFGKKQTKLPLSVANFRLNKLIRSKNKRLQRTAQVAK